jgi:hypothetical protein
LLGQKAGGSGTGANILKDILMGGLKRQAPSRSTSPQAKPAQEPSSWASRSPATNDIESEARQLEDLLIVANSRSSGRSASPQQQPVQPAPRQPADAPATQGGWGGTLRR